MNYKAKQDIPMRLGLSAFILPEGSELSIEQVDKQYRKVLVRVGRDIDWVSDSIMNHLEVI